MKKLIDKIIKNRTDLTQEYVRELFNYKDRFLYWKTVTIDRILVGSKAGSLSNEGRLKVQIFGKKYSNSRIIFLWHHGLVPLMIDHIDRNVDNDRIENLRPATYSQNNRNRTSARGSSSIYLGVNRHSDKRGWEAAVSRDNRRRYIGYFNTEHKAALAYNRVAVSLYGDFANLNILRP